MKKTFIVIPIIFFSVYVLLDYLFDSQIDFKMAIVSTIIFTSLELIHILYEKKKHND